MQRYTSAAHLLTGFCDFTLFIAQTHGSVTKDKFGLDWFNGISTIVG